MRGALGLAVAIAALCAVQCTSAPAPQVGEGFVRASGEYPTHDPDATDHTNPRQVDVTRKQKEGLRKVHELEEEEKYKAALTANSVGVASKADKDEITHHEGKPEKNAEAPAAEPAAEASASSDEATSSAESEATKSEIDTENESSKEKKKGASAVKASVEAAKSEASANMTKDVSPAEVSAAKSNNATDGTKQNAGATAKAPDSTTLEATKDDVEAPPQNDLGEGAEVEFEDHRLPECLKVLQAGDDKTNRKTIRRIGERLLGEEPDESDEEKEAEEEQKEKEEDENLKLETESGADRTKECVAIVQKAVAAVLDDTAALEVEKATLLREAHIAHIPGKLDDRDYGIQKTKRPIEGASSAQVSTMTGIADDAQGNKTTTKRADEVSKAVEKTIDAQEGSNEDEEDQEEEQAREQEKNESEEEAGIEPNPDTKSEEPIAVQNATEAHNAVKAEKQEASAAAESGAPAGAAP